MGLKEIEVKEATRMSNPAMFMPNLTIKDKVNFPFILANAILNFHNAIIKEEGLQSEQAVREAVLCLFNSIPASWRAEDIELKKDLKKALKTRKIDVRPEWCGRKVGTPKYQKEYYIEPYALYHACINVMDRKGLLSKAEKTEVIEGRYFNGNLRVNSNGNERDSEPEPEQSELL